MVLNGRLKAAIAFLVGTVLFSLIGGLNTLASFWSIIDEKMYEYMIDSCNPSEGEGDILIDDRPVLQHVHLAYVVDASRFDMLLNSMISVGRHLSEPEQCSVHVIVPEKDFTQAQRVVACFLSEMKAIQKQPQVKLHKVQPVGLNLTAFRDVWQDYWPAGSRYLNPMSFAQLNVTEYFPNESRVLWLSVETIVRTDLKQLFQMRMRTALAAAFDWKRVTWRSEYGKDLLDIDPSLLDGVGDQDRRVLNTGVLLFDLDKWRQQDISSKLEHWLIRVGGIKLMQLALNLQFGEDFDRLSWRWNVMGLFMTPPERCLENAKILHWAGPLQPGSPDMPDKFKALCQRLVDPFKPSQHCAAAQAMLDSDE